MVVVKRISVRSSATVFTYMFLMLGVLNTIILNIPTIATTFRENPGYFITLLLTLPIAYAVSGAILGALFSLVYNLLSKRLGGLKVELEEEHSSVPK